VKTESAIIVGVAIIALVLGVFAIYQTTTLTQQLDLANGKITTLQNNYNDSLTSLNDLQSTVIALNSNLTSAIKDISTLQTCCSRFERLNFTSAYATYNATNWNITINIQNIGSSNVTVTSIYLNGRPISYYNGSSSITLPISIVSGDQKVLWVVVNSSSFTSGQTVRIKLHTTSVTDYFRSVVLP
jgi:hypothetical protein